MRGQRFLDDDGEHLLGTLLSLCRSLCDACVEVVACKKNEVTHMKRMHKCIIDKYVTSFPKDDLELNFLEGNFLTEEN